MVMGKGNHTIELKLGSFLKAVPSWNLNRMYDGSHCDPKDGHGCSYWG